VVNRASPKPPIAGHLCWLVRHTLHHPAVLAVTVIGLVSRFAVDERARGLLEGRRRGRWKVRESPAPWTRLDGCAVVASERLIGPTVPRRLASTCPFLRNCSFDLSRYRWTKSRAWVTRRKRPCRRSQQATSARRGNSCTWNTRTWFPLMIIACSTIAAPCRHCWTIEAPRDVACWHPRAAMLRQVSARRPVPSSRQRRGGPGATPAWAARRAGRRDDSPFDAVVCGERIARCRCPSPFPSLGPSTASPECCWLTRPPRLTR